MTGKLVREKVFQNDIFYSQSVSASNHWEAERLESPKRLMKKKLKKYMKKIWLKQIIRNSKSRKWRKKKSQGKLWLGTKRVIERQVKKDAITRSRIGDSRLIKHNKFNMEGLRH